MQPRQRLALVGVVILLLLGLCVGYVILFGGSSVRVTTDTTPVKLEINDTSYDLNSDERTIRLASGSYNYRASAVVDGKRIVMVDKIDLESQKHVDLNLNFSIYNDDTIRSVLCTKQANNCPFKTAQLKTTYTENYQWAAVLISDPSLGDAAAVLRVTDGSWSIEGGPGTDFESGSFPESVEEALQSYGF